jgi:hypothetical protein
VIINGFTPLNERSTESLAESIRLFNVEIVCVIDFEMLAQDLKRLLKATPEIMIIELPKSSGV